MARIDYHPDIRIHSDVFVFVRDIDTSLNQQIEFITVVDGGSGTFVIEVIGKHINLSCLTRNHNLDIESLTAFSLTNNHTAVTIKVTPQFPF